jgi:hypothetical protein
MMINGTSSKVKGPCGESPVREVEESIKLPAGTRTAFRAQRYVSYEPR